MRAGEAAWDVRGEVLGPAGERAGLGVEELEGVVGKGEEEEGGMRRGEGDGLGGVGEGGECGVVLEKYFRVSRSNAR